MGWKSMGFKDNPLSISPILMDTLSLYVGHEEKLQLCRNVLENSNTRIVIEGARGVGTTSFANYLRFSLQEEKVYFTPRNEIRVDHGWQLETLLAVIIANVVRELDYFEIDHLTKDKRFQNAKALSSRIAETYRSFGVDAFGFGGSFGKEAGIVTQPIIVPAPVLGHHLEDLASLVQESGYSNGLLIQLNNLDVGEIHDEVTLKRLFNALRDYSQTRGISWLFVGDVGLRKFIAQNVDRLDDIISFETEIEPLDRVKIKELIKKRVEFYRISSKIKLPIDLDVFFYLQDVTKGRLRYVFGILTRLMGSLYIGDLTDRITLDIAKPMIIKLAKDRVAKNNLSSREEDVLRQSVKIPNATAATIADKVGNTRQYVGRILKKLEKNKLIFFKRRGTYKHVETALDAVIAYGDE